MSQQVWGEKRNASTALDQRLTRASCGSGYDPASSHPTSAGTGSGRADLRSSRLRGCSRRKTGRVTSSGFPILGEKRVQSSSSSSAESDLLASSWGGRT